VSIQYRLLQQRRPREHKADPLVGDPNRFTVPDHVRACFQPVRAVLRFDLLALADPLAVAADRARLRLLVDRTDRQVDAVSAVAVCRRGRRRPR